ncbi:4,5-DOPA dioxygenase extradiol [Hornefia butyriciproducens]|jgi:4,5-DOPA dioxygenase extradiol|uniref:4,5-DOPA-extradiol-dioxygenase n=1 Tax=Hornefia butyriciproducens TaxID=2652293 RepID=UPI0029FB0410|nr:4,5-DOPA dioxygenase extradiol [Hornefia butyriciproducens]MCI7327028.1 4,5-DOPA dioxygenase extradiol [Clostridiales bacterium]MCI7413308.1 4,5-DOPA dioxygenase extradiol [Clostridiales bacterium]MDD7019104.1 4,5-DOPA dioxygenase extradiol [Hornefia butyriciproducens]MDY2990348.1 4,5-DOPA dioxygenase extradiol [Hornefia butyriciproducens]MDY6212818.1 4,5-DOPA dioxygenase extradiol [Hornefia butyriciproducens]
MNKMPVVFSGHGDPMIALRRDALTEEIGRTGERILKEYGRPQAILSVSAHWYTRGTFVQTAENPRQIYDMYGFPEELYQVRYPVSGCEKLSDRVLALLGSRVAVNDEWGIDHGTWSILVHMFPKADIPVVQLSVDSTGTAADALEIGRKLAALREEGYLIFGSGNVVHNLRLVDWDNPGGTGQAEAFNRYIADAVLAGETDKVVNYESGPEAAYAVPTPEHFLPLIYCLGAADGDSARIFNNVCSLGSMAMTGFVFGER